MAITALKLGATLPIIMSHLKNPPSSKIKQHPKKGSKMVFQLIHSLTIPHIIVDKCVESTEEKVAVPKAFSAIIDYP